MQSGVPHAGEKGPHVDLFKLVLAVGNGHAKLIHINVTVHQVENV